MIIDTHVHYNLEPLAFQAAKHWHQAKEAGVTKSIIVGTDWESINKALAFSHEDANLFVSVGFHPSFYQESVESQSTLNLDDLLQDLETDMFEARLVAGDPKVVAIGETGLDYFRLPSDEVLRDRIIELQKKAFLRHLELAREYNLPVICHVRDKELPESETAGNAYWDALSILKSKDITRFTLHCVSGPTQYVQAAVEMGGYMGFDGNITYPKAEAIRELFKLVPVDRRLVETDAPYLPPQEFRGKVCEPWMIAKTVEYIEQTFGEERSIFNLNAEILFSLE